MLNIEEVLELHLKWLNGEEGGKRADLRSADLSYTNLSYANLSYADLPKGFLNLNSHTYQCFYFNGYLRIGCQVFALKDLTTAKIKDLVEEFKINSYDLELFKDFIKMCKKRL